MVGNTAAIGNNILNSHPKRHGDLASIVTGINISNSVNGNVVAAANKILSRDAAKVVAPVTIEEMFDCNDIAVANNILNNLAAELGCTVLALGITAQDIMDVNTENYKPFVAKLYANVQKADAMPKRDLLDIDTPITISDILNCNNVEVANNILNGLAAALGCTIADLGITVQDLIHCENSDDVASLLAVVQAALARIGGEQKRDDVNLTAPGE